MGITIDAKHVHVKDGTLRLRQYADGSLAVQVEFIEREEGFSYPTSETLSVNMSAYLPTPMPHHFYVKGYGEHEGLAEAIVAAGLAEVIGDPIDFGPFDTHVYLMRLAEKHRESTLTGTHRDYAVGDDDDTPDDSAVMCKFHWGEVYDERHLFWTCTRYREHNGNHAAGTGAVIGAVHPKEAS